ncbi:Phosphoglucomutase-2 [Aphelenchoides besseyi]|nr:Phosphoglucomutase-2 [Aphelenchoides besseyi]
MSTKPELQTAIDTYLSWEKNETALAEAKEFIKNAQPAELEKYFCGVRVRMAPGLTALNHLTIIQLSHGLAKYLQEVHKKPEKLSIVIGYDGRHRSAEFAKDAASVFIRNGINVKLFTKVVPTPVVSFATPFLKCDAGLMITASHNPKQDNGYKAYWSNGAQIVAPHDVNICKLAFDGSAPNPEYFDWSVVAQSQNVDYVLDEYIKSEARLCRYAEANAKTKLKFTYSAFHGVGYESAKKMFDAFRFPEQSIVSVKEQCTPDPNFTTVSNPNPEEGVRVLGLCFKVAEQNASTVVLVNDPDADRIQVAEFQETGEWRAFTGNEMGVILTWWTWKHFQEENPNADLTNVYILNSAVSSQFARTLSKTAGFQHDVALTGFKWIGNLAHQLRSKGKNVILGWEESIGYMPGTTLDKDGVSVAAVFAEIANYLNEKGLKLSDQLFEIFKTYGFHLTRNSYFIVPSKDVIRQVFEKRSRNPPTTINGHKIDEIRDLTVYATNKTSKLPSSATSPMITYTLSTGSIITLRASGTEPKLKYYIELVSSTVTSKKVYDQLDELEKAVINELLTPAEFGLIAREK